MILLLVHNIFSNGKLNTTKSIYHLLQSFEVNGSIIIYRTTQEILHRILRHLLPAKGIGMVNLIFLIPTNDLSISITRNRDQKHLGILWANDSIDHRIRTGRFISPLIDA
ncbi:hypothetical protein D3C81_1536420 [compost metagenome]